MQNQKIVNEAVWRIHTMYMCLCWFYTSKYSKKGAEMRNIMQINREDYIIERDYRKKRLEEFQEAIQENLKGLSTEIINELVDERERQNLTQKDVADITGILPYNLARFETGTRIPTLMVLEKYASALDKHIEIRLCDNVKK